MKILVFDDNELHRKAAAVQLKGHDVTIVGTYNDTQAALTPKLDYDKSKQFLVEMGWPETFRQWGEGVTEEQRTEYNKAREAAQHKATTYPDFEVFLGDLLVPVSDQAMGPDGYKHIGKEMPVGISLAFLALHQGVKLVAIVTDTNHHNHPASATFDVFRGKAIKLGDAKVMLLNEMVTGVADENTLEEVAREFLATDEGKEKYPYDKATYHHRGLIRVKVWDQVLEQLLKA